MNSIIGGVFMNNNKLCLLKKRTDSFGIPRPMNGSSDVPVSSSFFMQIYNPGDKNDSVNPDSVSAIIRQVNGETLVILEKEQKFVNGFSGCIFELKDRSGQLLSLYFDNNIPLDYNKEYSIIITASSFGGAALTEPEGIIKFTTSASTNRHKISHELDINNNKPTKWHGQFFGGLLKPSFCTTLRMALKREEFINQARKEYPKAWNLQRDFWLTGFEHNPDRRSFRYLPNIVREKETRLII